MEIWYINNLPPWLKAVLKYIAKSTLLPPLSCDVTLGLIVVDHGDDSAVVEILYLVVTKSSINRIAEASSEQVWSSPGRCFRHPEVHVLENETWVLIFHIVLWKSASGEPIVGVSKFGTYHLVSLALRPDKRYLKEEHLLLKEGERLFITMVQG